MKYFKFAVMGAIVAFVLPLAYAVRIGLKEGGKWLNSSFMQGMVGNLLATVIGIAVGLPIALWVNRVAQRNSNRDEDARLARERAETEWSILNILHRELKDNEPGLVGAGAGTIRQFHYFTGRWQAIVGGGGIQSIGDPEIVAAIAHTYERIDALNQLAVHWLASIVAGNGREDEGVSTDAPRGDSLKRLVIAAANESVQHVQVTLPIVTARIAALSADL